MEEWQPCHGTHGIEPPVILRVNLTLSSTSECGYLTTTTHVWISGGGMPSRPVRVVWLPECRTHYLSARLLATAARGGSGSPAMVAEYERLTGRPSPTRRAIRRLPYMSRRRYPGFKRTHR